MDVKAVEVIQVIHPGPGKLRDTEWVSFYTKQGVKIASSPLTAHFRAALEGKDETQDNS